MIVSSPNDYREAAKNRLPPFLFHYIDGGAGDENTLLKNSQDLQDIALNQRVLRDTNNIDTKTVLFGKEYSLPLGLSPVGLAGMYRRRGEIQSLKAANRVNIPFALSTVSVCALEELADNEDVTNLWFQLYVLKDRGFMKNALERAQSLGVKNLVFTVDMPIPGARYRDMHSGMSGNFAEIKRILQAITHPQWAIDVGLLGMPHDLGNISNYLGKSTGLKDYIGWLGANFDPSISWSDIEWIRDFWQGPMIIKGILNKEDALDALKFGADAIVVSNHGGRQLDGVSSSVKALPDIANAVKGKMKIISDSGIRSGNDILRMLALGADFTMIGRPYIYALAAEGQLGIEKLTQILTQELKIAMTLTGVKSIKEIDANCLKI